MERFFRDDPAYRTGLPLAHGRTSSDPEVMREQQAPLFRRPPHAVQGALWFLFSMQELVDRVESGEVEEEALRGVMTALVSAVARHHQARAQRWDGVKWDETSWEEMNRVLRRHGVPFEAAAIRQPSPDEVKAGTDFLIRPDDPDCTPGTLFLYWLVVRALRLADQKATREWATQTEA